MWLLLNVAVHEAAVSGLVGTTLTLADMSAPPLLQADISYSIKRASGELSFSFSSLLPPGGTITARSRLCTLSTWPAARGWYSTAMTL